MVNPDRGEVLVIVRPDPITDWPAVTEIPVPLATVPVADVWKIPPEPTYKFPAAMPLLVVVLKRLDITLPETCIGKVPVYVVPAGVVQVNTPAAVTLDTKSPAVQVLAVIKV